MSVGVFGPTEELIIPVDLIFTRCGRGCCHTLPLRFTVKPYKGSQERELIRYECSTTHG